MTSKADSSEEEWTRIKRAPFVAGMAISLADPGGPIELVKETAATLKSVQQGRGRRADAGSWSMPSRRRSSRRRVSARTRSTTSRPRARWPDRRSSRSSREVNRIVSAKATAEEADGIPGLAHDRRSGGRRRGQGGRVHGLPRGTRERGRAADARQAAAADASAGWCVDDRRRPAALLAAYLPAGGRARRARPGERGRRQASSRRSGGAVRSRGGFRVSGTLAVRERLHALRRGSWAAASSTGRTGARRSAGGVPDIRSFLRPRERGRRSTTRWDVVGLAGTGSHDIGCWTGQ